MNKEVDDLSIEDRKKIRKNLQKENSDAAIFLEGLLTGKEVVEVLDAAHADSSLMASFSCMCFVLLHLSQGIPELSSEKGMSNFIIELLDKCKLFRHSVEKEMDTYYEKKKETK